MSALPHENEPVRVEADGAELEAPLVDHGEHIADLLARPHGVTLGPTGAPGRAPDRTTVVMASSRGASSSAPSTSTRTGSESWGRALML